ncbi:MAG: helix-turn-helix transcriptional regulator [Fibromonadales bacterium]|nr:helix-turn-helix transcriptional regulator [Fibromonadales bacterium]
MIKSLNEEGLTQAVRLLLCEERKKRNMSQFDLARESGLTRQCIALFESGQRVPTFFSLFSLAKGFNMSAVKLISMLVHKMDFYERQQKLLAADSKNVKCFT